MSIQDFYRKFVSEENALVETLRRLSLLEDPKTMFEEVEPWNQWSEACESVAAVQV
jgi:hypothetical protein